VLEVGGWLGTGALGDLDQRVEDRCGFSAASGARPKSSGCTIKALGIMDGQAKRIAWLEGMLDLWRCPVHGEFDAGSAFDGTGRDDCDLRDIRPRRRRQSRFRGRAMLA
jgi:hypothetical protein